MTILLVWSVAGRGTSWRQEASVRVVIHADTLLEVDGHSTIPPLFGVMYAAAMIPAITSFSLSLCCCRSSLQSDAQSTEQWVRLLGNHHVDTVGLSQTLGQILPSSLPDLSVSGLQYWLMSGRAYEQYAQTSEYFALKSRQAQKAGARPMLFLRNPDGWCEPMCQQAYCWKRGETTARYSEQ